jgi:hypothetical protein
VLERGGHPLRTIGRITVSLAKTNIKEAAKKLAAIFNVSPAVFI